MKKYAKETYMNNYEDMILNQNCGNKTFWHLMGRLVGRQSKISATPPLQTPMTHTYLLIQKHPIYSMTIFVLFLRLTIQASISQNSTEELIRL